MPRHRSRSDSKSRSRSRSASTDRRRHRDRDRDRDRDRHSTSGSGSGSRRNRHGKRERSRSRSRSRSEDSNSADENPRGRSRLERKTRRSAEEEAAAKEAGTGAGKAAEAGQRGPGWNGPPRQSGHYSPRGGAPRGQGYAGPGGYYNNGGPPRQGSGYYGAGYSNSSNAYDPDHPEIGPVGHRGYNNGGYGRGPYAPPPHPYAAAGPQGGPQMPPRPYQRQRRLPEGYVCKICNIPGHHITNCPQKARPNNGPRRLPEGYVCKICKIPGHHINDCPQKNKQSFGSTGKKEEKEEDDGKCKTIRVSNLMKSVTNNLARLLAVFGKFGRILNTAVRPEFHCAYVEYAQRSSALAAVKHPHRWPFPQHKGNPITVRLARNESVSMSDAPKEEVKDERTLAREKRLEEKRQSVEEMRKTQAEIEGVVRGEIAKLKDRYKAFTKQTLKSEKEQLKKELAGWMKQLKDVKAFQRGVADAISGKKVTISTPAIATAAAASTDVRAVGPVPPSSEKSGPTASKEDPVEDKPVDTAEDDKLGTEVPSGTGELIVDYGEEDEEETPHPTPRDQAEAQINSKTDKEDLKVQSKDAETPPEQLTGAAKLLSLTSKLQGIVSKQGMKIRAADPNAPKKWNRADMKKGDLTLDLRTRTLEWVGFVSEFCPAPATEEEQMNCVKSAFKFFWANVAPDGVVIDGESALVTFKSRKVAERCKRLKSGKEFRGKTMLIRWKEGYKHQPKPKPTEPKQEDAKEIAAGIGESANVSS